MNLKNNWKQLISNYTNDLSLIENSFNVLKVNYTSKQRYYHNFNHISSMLTSISKITDIDLQSVINDDFFFALWYHDVIYIPGKMDNEVKSADFANKWLTKINFNNLKTKTVCNMILRTQNHFENCNDNLSTKLFLDCDLHILGSERAVYIKYLKQIRQEFAFVDDISYKIGRTKVLNKFLENKFIYKTSYYHDKYEAIARNNIEYELRIKN